MINTEMQCVLFGSLLGAWRILATSLLVLTADSFALHRGIC
jgi:hypothetical protein